MIDIQVGPMNGGIYVAVTGHGMWTCASAHEAFSRFASFVPQINPEGLAFHEWLAAAGYSECFDGCSAEDGGRLIASFKAGVDSSELRNEAPKRVDCSCSRGGSAIYCECRQD